MNTVDLTYFDNIESFNIPNTKLMDFAKNFYPDYENTNDWIISKGTEIHVNYMARVRNMSLYIPNWQLGIITVSGGYGPGCWSTKPSNVPSGLVMYQFGSYNTRFWLIKCPLEPIQKNICLLYNLD